MHLLHKLFRVALHGLKIISIVAKIHLAHFFDHVFEFVVLLEEEDDLLGVGAGAFGDTDNALFVESLLYFFS